jgi:hypothetical protein
LASIWVPIRMRAAAMHFRQLLFERLCGWWCPGRYAKSARQEKAAPAPAPAVPCPDRPAPDALSRRKGTGAAPALAVAVVAAQMVLGLV